MIGCEGKQPTTQSPKALAVQFGARTTMHGIGRALDKNTSTIEKIFWGCLVVALSCWALHSVLASIRTYMDHPVSTVVTQEFSPPLRFPGVTFCNMNRMLRSKMSNKTLEIINKALDHSTTDTRVVMIRKLKGLLDSLSAGEAMAAGHSARDMLVGCVFNSSKCDTANFTHFFSPVYGNCFTFGSNLLAITNAGRNTGLTLDLNAQIEEYTPLTTSLGIRVLLHDPKTKPFPEEGGFTATIGQVTSIGFREKRVQSLPHPYSDCLEDGIHKELNIFGKFGFYYNRPSCIRSNFQKKLLKICGCCSKWYPCDEDILKQTTMNSVNLEKQNKSTHFCVIPSLEDGGLDQTSTACYLGLLGAIEKLDLMEGCPAPCSFTLYQTTVSASHLPSRDLLAYGRHFNQGLPTANYSQEQPSIVRVEVFFQDLSTEFTKSIPAYDANNLLGDIGGQLGLLLGFSLVTAVEVLELLALLTSSVVCKLRKLWMPPTRVSVKPMKDLVYKDEKENKDGEVFARDSQPDPRGFHCQEI